MTSTAAETSVRTAVWIKIALGFLGLFVGFAVLFWVAYAWLMNDGDDDS